MNSKQSKLDAVKAAGEVYIDAIESHLDEGSTPVSGGKYDPTLADGSMCQLFDTGEMRSKIKSKPYRNKNDEIVGVEVGIFPSAPKIDRLKASGHNKGDSLNGKFRQFIPSPNKKFKEEINKGAQSTVNSFKKEKTATTKSPALSSTVTDILSDDNLDRLISSVLNG